MALDGLRNRLLAELESIDAARNGWVPAGVIEGAMKVAGAEPGRPQDDLLLLLQVDPKSGQVCYERLKAEVQLSSAIAPVSEVKVLPQPDLVFKRLKDLRVLFNKFDIGSISLPGFREELAGLGFKETQACADLFRHPYEMTFNHFIQALARTDEIAASDTTVFSSSSTPSRDKLTTSSTSRRLGMENANSNTASSLISNPVTGNFVTSSQAADRSGLGIALSSASAGYVTVDKGLLRSQVHAAVRMLDNGELDDKAFVRRLKDLGVTMPEAATRLMEKFKYGSRVPFKDWIKAFESHLDTSTLVDLDPLKLKSLESTSTVALSNPLARGQGSHRKERPAIFGEIADSVGDKVAVKNLSTVRGATRSNATFGALIDGAPDSTKSTDAQHLLSTRGRGGSATLPARVGAPWLNQVTTAENMKTRSTKAQVGGMSASKRAPFALEGEVFSAKSITGVPSSPQRRGTGRTPFGTEADYAASFASGAAPTLG